MASAELVFRGGTELKLDPIMTEYVKPEKIKSIAIGSKVAYISERCGWSYKFVKVNGVWELEKIDVKRRCKNGRYKASTRRNVSRERKNSKIRNEA